MAAWCCANAALYSVYLSLAALRELMLAICELSADFASSASPPAWTIILTAAVCYCFQSCALVAPSPPASDANMNAPVECLGITGRQSAINAMRHTWFLMRCCGPFSDVPTVLPGSLA